jgi:membrane fusion protein (multidrug efflux system)
METTRQAPKAPDPIQAAPAAPSPPAAEGPPEKKAMNPALRAVLIVAGAIVLVVVLIAVIRFLAYATTHQTTDDAQIDSDQVDVTSKIAERIDRVLVDTNQQVTKGQLLIQGQSRCVNPAGARRPSQRRAHARHGRGAEFAEYGLDRASRVRHLGRFRTSPLGLAADRRRPGRRGRRAG